jgi:outer membrane protein W
MKKVFLLTAIIALVAVSANAQNRFSKGDWVVGAQSNGVDLIFGRNLPTDAVLNLNAVGGYFFTDKFAVDVLAGYSYERSVS